MTIPGHTRVWRPRNVWQSYVANRMFLFFLALRGLSGPSVLSTFQRNGQSLQSPLVPENPRRRCTSLCPLMPASWTSSLLESSCGAIPSTAFWTLTRSGDTSRHQWWRGPGIRHLWPRNGPTSPDRHPAAGPFGPAWSSLEPTWHKLSCIPGMAHLCFWQVSMTNFVYQGITP